MRVKDFVTIATAITTNVLIIIVVVIVAVGVVIVFVIVITTTIIVTVNVIIVVVDVVVILIFHLFPSSHGLDNIYRGWLLLQLNVLPVHRSHPLFPSKVNIPAVPNVFQW